MAPCDILIEDHANMTHHHLLLFLLSSAKTDHPWRAVCVSIFKFVPNPLSHLSASVSNFDRNTNKHTHTYLFVAPVPACTCLLQLFHGYICFLFFIWNNIFQTVKIVSRSTKEAAQRRSQNAAVVHLNADAEEDDCFHRIPYASLIGSLLCILGVILFAIMMSWAFNATAEQVRRSLKINDWPWLDKVQVFFIVIAVLMGLFSLFFLCIGFTATGGTRETMYKGSKWQWSRRTYVQYFQTMKLAVVENLHASSQCWSISF